MMENAIQRRLLDIAAVLLLVAPGGCKRSDPVPPTHPGWLDSVDVQIVGHRKVFDGNTEVMLTVKNNSTDPRTIWHLEEGNAVELRNSAGVPAKLHALSVGVSKPLNVAPRETKTASLLFQSAPGGPTELRMWDRTFRVPSDR